MTYQDQLSPWVIHQLLPNLNRRVVARFRRRTEAESYLKIVKQMRSTTQFLIAFDAPVSTVTEGLTSTKVTSATTIPAVSR
ncbi:MAG: hypothetical protein SFY66_15160 [Oculatellaceae cyanobacterium bins.114]|nr:hypothetical protein [Oculatellaceae cyanobacterium bins.114]